MSAQIPPGFRQPPPGLQGDYRDTCVACLRGTDSGLLITGAPEFILFALTRMGLPWEEARRLVCEVAAHWYGCDLGMLPLHDMEFPARVCPGCAARAGFQATGWIPPGNSARQLYCYRMPDEMRSGEDCPLSEDDLEQARELHGQWAERRPRPIVISHDHHVLGSWSIRKVSMISSGD